MDEYWHWINVKVKWGQKNKERKKFDSKIFDFNNIFYIDFESASQQHSMMLNTCFSNRCDGRYKSKTNHLGNDDDVCFVHKIYKNLILYEKFIYFLGIYLCSKRENERNI